MKTYLDHLYKMEPSLIILCRYLWEMNLLFISYKICIKTPSISLYNKKTHIHLNICTKEKA